MSKLSALGQASAAGSGLEVINVEVASFRLGAPAAGSGLQDLIKRRSCKLSA